MFHEKLREIAQQYPNSPAVVWQGTSTSYKELDIRSDEIAEELSASGVSSGDVIPIFLGRGIEWIAYSIGVLKAGAAYVPISDGMPPERLEYIVSDIKNHTIPNNAMTLYYTSGSTGVPKGVILTHENVMAFCKSHAELFGFCHGIKGGVQADVGFDSFLLSTLPILYCGGTICIMNDTERLSLIGIHQFLIKNKIDTAFLTTGLAVEYMRAFDNRHLKILLTGGEAIHTYTPRSYAVYNLYGPTECTVYVTAHKLQKGESGDIPIGVPTGKNRAYIIEGELCISGPQLSFGYIGRAEETAQRFVQNPYYNPNNDEECYRLLYRTGDLARWTDDGCELLYCGRIDNQVKISGYRIEPEEIEVALSKHPDVFAACVTTRRTADGEPYLTAYYVTYNNIADPKTLKTFLSQSLPSYMIPHKFIMLDKLPVDTRTGKVDYKALQN